MHPAAFPCQVGDPILRVIGNQPPERLRISALDARYIIAGPFRFDRLTLTEVTDFGDVGPSYLLPNDRLALLDAMTEAAQDFPGGYR
jgi:hypothetical protein